jgi:hypothetical protein
MRQARSAHSVVGVSRCCRQKTFFSPAAREEEKRHTSRHNRTKSLSAGSRKQTKAAAADDIPAGYLASSPCHAPIVAVNSQICCPARLLVGDLTATHESPKTWPTRHRLCVPCGPVAQPMPRSHCRFQKPGPLFGSRRVALGVGGRAAALHCTSPALNRSNCASGGLGAPRASPISRDDANSRQEYLPSIICLL